MKKNSPTSSSLNSGKKSGIGKSVPYDSGEQLELLLPTPSTDPLVKEAPKVKEPASHAPEVPADPRTAQITANWPSPDTTKHLEADMGPVLQEHLQSHDDVESLLPSSIGKHRWDINRFNAFWPKRKSSAGAHDISANSTDESPTESVVSYEPMEQSATEEEELPDTEKDGTMAEDLSAGDKFDSVQESVYTTQETLYHSPLLPTEEPDRNVVEFPRKQVDPESLSDGFEEDDLSLSEAYTSVPVTPLAFRKATSFITPIVSTCFVPLLFCLGFWGFSKVLSLNPLITKHILVLSSAVQAIVPPPELELVNLQSEVVTLDDGKQVLEVKGKIFNNSPLAVRDVTLQAKLFDKENQPLTSLIVHSNNGLLNASRISSLKEGAIETLQSKNSVGSKVILPKEESPFRIIFTGPLGGAHWFSARVYSVKPNTEV